MITNKHKIDRATIVIIFILLSVGIVILASASTFLSQQNFGESYYYVKHQIFFGLILGLALFAVALKIKYSFWSKLALAAFAFNIILLIMVFLPPFGQTIRGVQRWLSIGGLSFQPSELLKLTLIMYLAAIFTKQTWQASSFKKGFLPFIIIISLISTFLILQPDIGTLVIILISAFMVYFLAGAKLYHIALLFIIGILGLSLLVRLEPYRLNRITAFLNPNIDPQGISYQLTRSIMFIGSGKILGSGLGQNSQQYRALPEAMGDSIFAVIAQELGFIGVTAILAAFIFLAVKGFLIAKNAPDTFGKLLAVGITSFISFQALLNISAISGSIPLTGVPLPLISYGSSTLIVTLFSLGILLNISKYQKSHDQ